MRKIAQFTLGLLLVFASLAVAGNDTPPPPPDDIIARDQIVCYPGTEQSNGHPIYNCSNGDTCAWSPAVNGYVCGGSSSTW